MFVISWVTWAVLTLSTGPWKLIWVPIWLKVAPFCTLMLPVVTIPTFNLFSSVLILCELFLSALLISFNELALPFELEVGEPIEVEVREPQQLKMPWLKQFTETFDGSGSQHFALCFQMHQTPVRREKMPNMPQTIAAIEPSSGLQYMLSGKKMEILIR